MENTPDQIKSFEVFCEMVSSDAKPIALSHPMDTEEADQVAADFENIADEYEVKIYRETSFPVTLLFPNDVTEGKEVFVIYREPRLVQYNQLKNDIQNALNPDFSEKLVYARRMGRLLGYSPQGINELLMRNTDFRSLPSFGVKKQITHLYYENLDEAVTFYRNVLGLQETDLLIFKIGQDSFVQLHAVDKPHPAGQPKSTAIALLTDQLPEWYEYIQSRNVPVKYTYKPKEEGPHDGFVAVDPGGYLLEFEQFKQHPENELLMAVLENAPRISTNTDTLSFYGSITWTYHNDLLRMQNFYEKELGFRRVADQGWTKIFWTSPTGFIGLVDEKRGMMDYSEEKAVEIEWQLENSKEFNDFLSKDYNWNVLKNEFKGPEGYIYQIN